MSETDESLGFPPKGALRRNPMPKLVRNLARARATGSLYLLNGDTKKVVFFREGQPTFVRSNQTSECLGQVLAREGLITQEQCDQTLEAIRRTGKKQGELLVEMGILSEGNLRYGLQAQLRHKLFDIFGWEDGRYQFKAEIKGDDFGLGFNFESPGLIVTALVEICDPARAERALKGVSSRYPIAEPDAAEGIDILPIEAHFISCLDGSRSVEEVLAEAKDVAQPTVLLYASIQAGITKLAKTARPARERAPAPDDYANVDDDYLRADYDAVQSITDYEDTPLPGALPEAPAEDDDGFEGIEQEDDAAPAEAQVERSIDEDLVAAEPDAVEETFSDEVEILDDDELELIEEDDDLSLESDDEVVLDGDSYSDGAIPSGADLDDEEEDDDDIDLGDPDADLDDDDIDLGDPDAALDEDDEGANDEGSDESGDEGVHLGDVDEDLALDDDDGLMEMDDLDDIDLGEEESASLDPVDHGPASYSGSEATAPTDVESDPEVAGAMRFTEGEMAIQSEQWSDAVEHLEAAYEQGVDVAELHAMLAWGRFMEAGATEEMSGHALELLSYAEEMNPKLDMVFGYRAKVLLSMGDTDGAREAAEAALQIDEYSDLAMEVLDEIG